MLQELNDFDWKEAFKYAGTHVHEYSNDTEMPMICEGSAEWVTNSTFSREDVTNILAIDYGVPDEESWIAIFKLNDERYAFLTAWCDYSGWG